MSNGAFLLVILAAVGGYVASVFTWPALRTKVLGVEAEVASLKARVTSLTAKL